jgi:hypothetical protein
LVAGPISRPRNFGHTGIEWQVGWSGNSALDPRPKMTNLWIGPGTGDKVKAR